jgi:hypothetical protein
MRRFRRVHFNTTRANNSLGKLSMCGTGRGMRRMNVTKLAFTTQWEQVTCSQCIEAHVRSAKN